MKKKIWVVLFPYYILFFIPTLAVIAAVWYFCVDGKLFYCADKLPIGDLFPPFVHGPSVGDYWIVSSSMVYSLWILAIVLLFLIPGVIVQMMYKRIVKK